MMEWEHVETADRCLTRWVGLQGSQTVNRSAVCLSVANEESFFSAFFLGWGMSKESPLTW